MDPVSMMPIAGVAKIVGTMMDPLPAAASIVGLVALANDVSRTALKIYEMNKIRKEGNSAFIRGVTCLMSVMDACTYCQCS